MSNARILLALVAWTLAIAGAVRADDVSPPLNGFALESRTIRTEEILPGGPPRDGIPALEAPPHVPIAAAPWPDDEVVLGLVVGGEARAYPVSILVWHELVNDELGGQPVLVSFCPLCGTGLAFDRRVEGTVHRFGVSGLLYRSDLLLFDRATGSLWSQISARAVTGPHEGRRLTVLRGGMHRLHAWRARHPASTILSRDTGYTRRYGDSPYGSYATSEDLYFPAPLDARFHAKMPTLGLRQAGGPARAYPASELVAAGGEVRERFAGHAVRVAYDPDEQVFEVEAPPDLEVVEGFWFAWMAFHPESSVYQAPEAPR